MPTLQMLIYKVWDKLLALAGALWVLLPTSPLNMRLSYKDSGVFLYIGWRILHGEIPYRDLWDHKPPVIFYLNALGLAISNHSRWGPWFIEVALLFVAAFLGFQLIKKLFGIAPAILSLLLWLLSLVFVLQGGNLTTEYTLPLQFAALWLVHHAAESKRPDWNFFFIGLTGAIAFFTKQTAVGIWIAIVLYLTVQRLFTNQGKRWMREMSMIVSGGMLFSIAIIAFFALQGVLSSFWSAAFEYNFLYASRIESDFLTRFHAAIDGLQPLKTAALVQSALAGYGVTLFLILFRRHLPKRAFPILCIGLLNLPLELALIGLATKTFAHYYMTLLPILAIFSAVVIWAVILWLPKGMIFKITKYVLTLAIAAWISWVSFTDYMDQLYIYRDFEKNNSVIEYITQNTSPNDQVLLWGSETSINYYSQRKSPTRFVYQAPLHEERYVNETMILEFLDETIENQPRLIIDTSPKIPLYSFPLTTETIQDKVVSLQANYCLIKNIDAWKIYEFSREPCEDR